MAQANAAGAAATTTTTTTEGGEAGGAVEPVRAPTLETIKAERRASAESTTDEGVGGAGGKGAAAGADGKGAGADGKGKAKVAAGKPAEVDIDDSKLTAFVKLNGDLRAAKERLRELEPNAAQAAKIVKATKLIAEGKNFDAIREVVGEEVFNAAVREVVGAGGEKPKADPEVAKLKEKIEELERGQTGTKEQLDAAAVAQREIGVNKIVEEVTGLTEQFPYLSRNPEWVKESLQRADKVYEVAKEKSVKEKGRDLNNTEKNALLRAALEVSEEEHVERAKMYGAPAAKKKDPPTAASAARKPVPARKVVDNTKKPTPRTVDNTMRGNVTSIIPKKKTATLEELKRERRMRS